ncbi:helix-turn-helix domain-containing protein [Azorhizobium caulinodans]|uniref:helix-turn-helix domain-containing protein n=2 Tax=Azorhizobium caulinodans TaxID=7 RepID=UPI0039EB6B41
MPMNARERLAWNLRALRVAQGLSQERLAADAGIDRAYVGGIERQTENPTIDLLDRLATTLHVDLAALLALPAEGETPPAPLRGGRPRRVS